MTSPSVYQALLYGRHHRRYRQRSEQTKVAITIELSFIGGVAISHFESAPSPSLSILCPMDTKLSGQFQQVPLPLGFQLELDNGKTEAEEREVGYLWLSSLSLMASLCSHYIVLTPTPAPVTQPSPAITALTGCW